ncbi:type II CRISPR RNA-guided endonuclease Cas9 [Shimia marina]|uniref:CRISPR-associated endonuclease Cas9 n=1 Tax=Shimia marina TaxID=321267 RepID=A0A0P1ETF1_9RHOB|nr:type II CRISPR RNA-guided endonuclease Cas9 [Shimia marina]CUH53721.1 CRISPR-associated endonuclease Cas9/Csn1 [Shimia marina]SFD70101.1 CRISPR-associated endonuclease Csn1 [Shimia marina]
MRLGLDIGTNSVGWWLYKTDGEAASARIVEVIDGGVRIFSDGRDPKSKTSLAVDRRVARAARRRRDRYLRRRASLMKLLARTGLMPADPVEAKKLERLDPYELRSTGLDDALPLTHFGRALFHLNQRRGFKSNRKTDRGDNENGKIREATARLDLEMMTSGARSYGEFLHMRRQRASDPRHVPSVRTRLSVAARGGPDAKAEAGYDFYPDRHHLEEEFHALWAAQATHHQALTDDLRDLVFEKIFYQRPLKEPKIGLCLFTAEERIAKAHPLTQRRVLFETINQLRVTADGRSTRPLTLEERDTLVHALDNKKPTKSMTSMNMTLKALAKLLKLRDGERFTLETGVRENISCDPVRACMAHPARFGPQWSSLDWEAQWDVISRVRQVQSEGEFIELTDWLIQGHGLDADHAKAVGNAPLPEGYARLGFSATERILDQLKAEVCTYSDAVAKCGWHHSDQRTGACLEVLPYYGEVLDRHVIPGTYDATDDEITRYGRITNPTVHIGLNQLRRLVNKIIEVHGKPDQIVVELARELKQSEPQKKDAMKRLRNTTADAIRRSEQLEQLGQPNTGHNRMLLRLWEDLGPAIGPRCCPYTGKTISVTMVFDGSCDVDHILPFSRTLDDSFANRTLCLKEANREKSDRTPWEAWGGTDQWDDIAANLKNLPEKKRKRFGPDAMEWFEGENDFLDRALVDTQYLAKISRMYLDTLFTKGGHVWVVPGRMTEMLRRHWGLNALLNDKDRGAVKAKNRTDHRHHAIDAAVVAATDYRLMQKISRAAGQGENAGQSAELIARDTDAPWEHFRADIASQLEKIIVSHRADHGRIDVEGRKTGRDSTAGRLHNDTAYGVIDDLTVASRTPLMSLKPSDIAITERGKNIRDPQLQNALYVATKGKEGKMFEQALVDFASKEGPYQGIRRVRLVETLQKAARVEIGKTESGQPLKAYKGDSNHCYELWKLPDGKIVPQVVTTYEAHAGSAPRPHPAAKRILRVFKKDMVKLTKDGEEIVGYVQSMHIKNGLFVAQHLEANADARNRDKTDPFKFLQMGAGTLVKTGLRRVLVDEIGRLRDPGPPKL